MQSTQQKEKDESTVEYSSLSPNNRRRVRRFLNHYGIEYKKLYKNRNDGSKITVGHIKKCIVEMEKNRLITVETVRFLKGVINDGSK